MYEVLIERHAEKDLKKLPRDFFHLVTNKIQSLAETPRMLNAKKLRAMRNTYRIRIGDYRVLYEIDDKSKTVKIYRVRHRKEVYR